MQDFDVLFVSWEKVLKDSRVAADLRCHDAHMM